MLIHAKGNLLAMAQAGDFDVIIHGCNCQHNMGGGIAAQIANQYPEAKAVDEEYSMYHDKPEYMLGNATTVDVEDGFTIVNGYTQLYGGSGSLSYAAMELVFMKVAAGFAGKRIGLPYIGCGIAGGDQEKIVDMIEKFAIKAAEDGTTVTLVEFAA